jgi:hypothetical protein
LNDCTAARDYVNNTNSGAPTGPYRQSYQHDVFGNMTQRDNRFWSQTDTFTASYSNNRRAGFSYDADGRLSQDSDLQYYYDAAGEIKFMFSPSMNKWQTLINNADGMGKGSGIVHRGLSASASDQDFYDAYGLVNELPHIAGSKGGWPSRNEYDDYALAVATDGGGMETS